MEEVEGERRKEVAAEGVRRKEGGCRGRSGVRREEGWVPAWERGVAEREVAARERGGEAGCAVRRGEPAHRDPVLAARRGGQGGKRRRQGKAGAFSQGEKRKWRLMG
jgi:hypothetical protein